MKGELYRCAGCGNGDCLRAWAGANVEGKLLADGTVEESYFDQWGTHEDSIECEVHLSAFPVLKRIDGAWTQAVPCGYVHERYAWMRCEFGKVSNGRGGTQRCPSCGGSGCRDVVVSAADLRRWRAKGKPALSDSRVFGVEGGEGTEGNAEKERNA